MKEQLEDMKSVLEEEERTADPEKQRMIRQGYREMYSTEAKCVDPTSGFCAMEIFTGLLGLLLRWGAASA